MITKRERWLMEAAFKAALHLEPQKEPDRLFKWWLNTADSGVNIEKKLDDQAPPREI